MDEDEAFDAIAAFEEMLKSDAPPFYEAHVYERIVEHYCELIDWESAQKALEWGVYFHPFSTELRLMGARIWAGLGNFQEAMGVVFDCETLQPLDADVKMAKGNVLMTFGHYDEAIECYKAIVDRVEDRLHALLNLAYAYQCKEEYLRAISYYKEVVALDASLEDAALDMIQCCQLAKQEDACEDFLKAQIDEKPYEACLWLYLGILYDETNRQEKAVQAFEYATLANEHYVAAFEHLGHSLMNLQRYAKAADAYQTAISLKKEDDARLYCHLAAAKEKQGDWAPAYQFYKKATAIDPRADDAWYGMGLCLAAKSSWMEAAHFFKKATEINRFVDEYWFNLATAEYNLGNMQSCQEAFEHASSINSYNPELWMRWSMAYYEQGDLSRALEIIGEGLAELPREAALYYRACAYSLYSSDYTGAFQYLETALYLDYDMHTVLYEFFDNLTMQKAIARIIKEIKSGLIS